MSRINGVIAMRLLDDLRLAKVEPLLFGAGRLCVSVYRPYALEDELVSYDGWWMYSTLDAALNALRDWDSAEPPAGWTKCQPVPEKLVEAAAARTAWMYGSPERAATLPRR